MLNIDQIDICLLRYPFCGYCSKRFETSIFGHISFKTQMCFFELTSFVIKKHLGRINSYSSQTSCQNQLLLKIGNAKVKIQNKFITDGLLQGPFFSPVT